MAKDDDDLDNPEITGNTISHGFDGTGTTSPADVRQRAEELAVIDGLRPNDVNEGHLLRARAELGGAAETPNDVVAESNVLADRDPIAGSSGLHTRNVRPSDDESVGEMLYAQGVEEAVHERMLTATETLERRERGLEADVDEN
jgi:hypothetical protein